MNCRQILITPVISVLIGELRAGGFYQGAPADLDTGVGSRGCVVSVMQGHNFIISAPLVQAGAVPLRGDV